RGQGCGTGRRKVLDLDGLRRWEVRDGDWLRLWLRLRRGGRHPKNKTLIQTIPWMSMDGKALCMSVPPAFIVASPRLRNEPSHPRLLEALGCSSARASKANGAAGPRISASCFLYERTSVGCTRRTVARARCSRRDA